MPKPLLFFFLVLAFILAFMVTTRAGVDPSANVTQSPLSLVFSTNSNPIYQKLQLIFSTNSNPLPEKLSLIYQLNISAPPQVSAQNATYTYQYGGSYNVSALVGYTTTVKFKLNVNETYDYTKPYNDTHSWFIKVYKDLPAGNYTVTVYGDNSLGSRSSTATLVINKTTPSGSISAPSVTYPNPLIVSASENNKGDNDVQYQIFCGNLKVSGLSGSLSLPAGSYTCILNTTAGPFQNYTASASIASVNTLINKGVPSLSLAVQNGTWIQGASVTTSKNNVGDSDLIYRTFIGNTYLGGVGAFQITNLPSGIYDVVFNVTEGQNWTSASVSKKLEIYKAWEKTDSIYSNKSYRYDYDKSAVPVVAYFKYKSANSTAYVNKYLYVYSLTNVTNNDTILQQTFTNVIVNVSAPSGFILLNSSFSIPSLAYGEVHQANVYAKAVCVYEKAKSLNAGHATYTLTVNSSFVSELPVVYQLSAPPDWDKRTSYSITVDGKSTGFTFDPNTLTLSISTSFSHSSLEPGDHIIDLQYSLPSPPPSGPTPSTGGVQPSNVSTAPSGAPSESQVEVVNPPPQNVISTPTPVSGIFQILGIPVPLKYVFIVLMVIICVLLILVPRRKRRKATWLK